MEKKAEDKKIEERKPAPAYTPPPIKDHVLAPTSVRPRILIADDSFAELPACGHGPKRGGL